MTGREAALLALLSNRYIQETLQTLELDERERALAREIASGTMRMQLALDYLIQHTAHRKVKLNAQETALLRSAVYQLVYLERIPPYAVIDETLKLATTNKPFIHAILSKLSRDLPEGLSAKAMHTRLSYPLWFVKRLISTFGSHQAEAILEAQNRHVPIMARRIGVVPFVWTDPGPGCYIQNRTPATLLEEACETATRILDLCASPGGKLLAAHDLFPEAELFANDVSEKKLDRLRENLTTFDMQAHLTVGPGEAYQSVKPFDLIIVDAPCSNSGVLYKRAEARWRLTEVKPLIQTQRALLENAAKLLAPNGQLIYMTCSILPEENREQALWATRLGLSLEWERLILPHDDWEGGYAARLTLTTNSRVYK